MSDNKKQPDSITSKVKKTQDSTITNFFKKNSLTPVNSVPKSDSSNI